MNIDGSTTAAPAGRGTLARVSWEVGPIHRETVDGIPTVWADSPGRFEAGLVFRVGTCDEALPRRGITHLVEHLAHPPEVPRTYDFNGSVGPVSTIFWAAGRRALVLEHLARICQGLSEPDLARLERERAVLLAENSRQSGDPDDLALALRYGPVGFGLPGHRELGLRFLTAEAVADWARERFTADNAALYMTGPPAEDVVLPLPRGVRHPLPKDRPLETVSFPAVSDEGDWERVSLSIVCSDEPEVMLGLAALTVRALERLRFDLGLSYTVTAVATSVSADRSHVTLWADCAEGKEDAVGRELVAVLDRLVAEGPSAAEMARIAQADGRWIDEFERLPDELTSRAIDCLLGRPEVTVEEWRRRAGSADPEAIVRAIDRAADETALLVVPELTSLPKRGSRRFLRYPEPRGTRDLAFDTARRFEPPGRWRRKGRALVVGDGGAEEILPTGASRGFRVADCVALVHHGDGSRTVVCRDGLTLVVEPDDWRRGGEAVDLIDDLVPLERHAPLGPPPSG
jgi:zinc protease